MYGRELRGWVIVVLSSDNIGHSHGTHLAAYLFLLVSLVSVMRCRRSSQMTSNLTDHLSGQPPPLRIGISYPLAWLSG